MRMSLAQQTASEKVLEEVENRHPPGTLPEVRLMMKLIRAIGWVNLLIGLPSVLLVLNLKSLTLVATGSLSLLTFWLLRLVARHIAQTKSWTEVGVLIMCGVYFPSFIVWLCATDLFEAIMR